MVWSAASTDRQRPAHAFIQAHGHPAGSASRGVLSAGGARSAGRGETHLQESPGRTPWRAQAASLAVPRAAAHSISEFQEGPPARWASHATECPASHTSHAACAAGAGGGGEGHPGATREPAVPLPSVGASPPSVSPTSSPVQASAPGWLRATGAQVEGVDFSVHYGDPAEALSSHPLLELQGYYRMVRFSRAECTNAYIRKYYSCMNKQAPRCI